MSTLTRPALAFLLAALVVGAGSRALSYLAGGGVRSERLSGPAPRMRVERPGGERLALPDGRAAVIQFWVSWCPPCAREVPDLLAMRPELEGRGDVTLWLVSLDEDLAAVRRFFGGPVPDSVVRSLDRDAYAEYGVTGLPETYVVAAGGELVARFTGKIDWRAGSAREALLGALEDARRLGAPLAPKGR